MGHSHPPPGSPGPSAPRPPGQEPKVAHAESAGRSHWRDVLARKVPDTSDHRGAPIDMRRERLAEDCLRITRWGIASNIGLSVIKAVGGVIGNSAAMISDAAHSLSDLISDLVTYASFNVARRPADREHPFGHGKFESLGAFSVAGFLIVTGFGIGYHDFNRLQLLLSAADAAAAVDDMSRVLGPTSIALVTAIISVAVKEVLYHLTLKAAKRFNSPVIEANAYHHRSDSLSSLLAMGGIIGSWAGYPALDSVAGLAVAALITKMGLSSLISAVHDLTDSAVGGDLVDRLHTIVQHASIPGLHGYHQLRLRRMGPFVYVDMHIQVEPYLSVSAAHQIAERLRVSIISQCEEISEVLIHVDVEQDQAVEWQRSATTIPLPRTERDIRADIEKTVQHFPDVLRVGNTMCHFVNQQVVCDLQLVLPESMKLADASALARRVAQQVKADIVDVDKVNVSVSLLEEGASATPHSH